MAKGRYAALAGNQDQDDVDLPVPMMMLRDEGNVPPEQAAEENGVVLVPRFSALVFECPQEWYMAKITHKIIKADERTMGRLAQEALEPKSLLDEVSDSGSPQDLAKEAGRNPRGRKVLRRTRSLTWFRIAEPRNGRRRRRTRELTPKEYS